ncbi:hypothetical protein TcasGA2_TC003534 [Tribolium castaneum]|uniref:Uncharacterized protein n=1 Tax=Tribolium castaneum TaxID=7070 RepID=D6WHF5_TRICA|nr:hypothetical protein TcasGA2_TC003534 [Tribolium castaneum]
MNAESSRTLRESVSVGDFSGVLRNWIHVHYPTLPLVTARLGSFGSDTLWSLRNTDVQDERIYNLQSVCMFGK